MESQRGLKATDFEFDCDFCGKHVVSASIKKYKWPWQKSHNYSRKFFCTHTCMKKYISENKVQEKRTI